MDKLPRELLFQLLSYLDENTISQGCSFLNSHWHSLCKSDVLWHGICTKKFPQQTKKEETKDPQSPPNWEDFYFRCETAGVPYEGYTSAENARICLFGRVLAITEWLESHPGGSDVLLDIAGTDATRRFQDVGHSADAFLLLKKFDIGAAVDLTKLSKRARLYATRKKK